MRTIWIPGALAAAFALPILAGPAPDTILYGGKIITVDPNFSYAEALAISAGRILAVGADEEIRKLAGPATRQINLRGKTVIPGLADNHLHSAGGGPGVDLSRVRSMEELLETIRVAVRKSMPDDVVLTNADWHEAQLKEQRLPLRYDLDKVAPETPVVVVRGGHEYVLNSAALRKWNITPASAAPPGGSISRYDTGELNGELVDAAKGLVRLQPPAAKNLEARIREQQGQYAKLHAAGLTSVRHPGGSVEQYRLLQEMKKRGLLTMRVNFLVRLPEAQDAEAVQKAVASWGVLPDEGDDWLRIGGVKLGIDGGFEGGWMTQPYAEPYGKGGTYFGLQLIPQGTYTDIAKELNRLGWRVATHAVGDAAIDQVLSAYEAADKEKSIAVRRWSIEHAFLPREEHYAHINRLGILIAAQDHLYLAGPSLLKYWGKERAEWVTPLRSYLDHKVQISAGTDSPVVPYPPLWAIYHFITRETISGGVFGRKQRISRQEAIRISTMGNAYLDFAEKSKGSLEPGKLADLVVLSGDIMTCPDSEIPKLKVLMTFVDGRLVFQAPD
jgi:predicted amidohydrolase YtcJ